jgi:hypothetical protein
MVHQIVMSVDGSTDAPNGLSVVAEAVAQQLFVSARALA